MAAVLSQINTVTKILILHTPKTWIWLYCFVTSFSWNCWIVVVLPQLNFTELKLPFLNMLYYEKILSRLVWGIVTCAENWGRTLNLWILFPRLELQQRMLWFYGSVSCLTSPLNSQKSWNLVGRGCCWGKSSELWDMWWLSSQCVKRMCHFSFMLRLER